MKHIFKGNIPQEKFNEDCQKLTVFKQKVLFPYIYINNASKRKYGMIILCTGNATVFQIKKGEQSR